MSIRTLQLSKDNLSTFVDVMWRNDFCVDKSMKKKEYFNGFMWWIKTLSSESFYHIMLDDEIIGILSLRDKGNNFKMITMICIDGKHRFKGYGKQVIDWVKSTLEDRHDKLWVDIDVSQPTKNDLFKYYLKQGFNFDIINPDDGNILMKYVK